MGKKVFKDPESILQEDMNRLFTTQKPKDLDIFFSIFSLFLYRNEHNTDLLDIFNSVDFEDYVKLLQKLEGRTVKFPTLTQMTDSIIFTLVYYYKEIKGLNLDEIKEELYDVKYISKLSLSLKVTHFNSWLKQKIHEQLKKLGGK